MLFHRRENLLSLYNAVNRTSYTDADALTVVTLENVIYMNMKNDMAFILDDRLSLYEYQSTWNPNMPLRNLFYVSRTYQGFMKDEPVYSDRKIQIPTPHFIVFYNGMDRIPERVVLKLSDSFEKKDGEPELELIVTVLNINQGNNKEIMELCQVLREYMLYVEKMRRYAKVMGLNEAAEKTVSECIHEGILEDFLRQNREETVAMSIFEYDEKRELKLLRKAQFEYGRESLLKSKIITKLKKGKSLEQP